MRIIYNTYHNVFKYTIRVKVGKAAKTTIYNNSINRWLISALSFLSISSLWWASTFDNKEICTLWLYRYTVHNKLSIRYFNCVNNGIWALGEIVLKWENMKNYISFSIIQ